MKLSRPEKLITWKQTRETLALLGILALGPEQVERTRCAKAVFSAIRKRHG